MYEPNLEDFGNLGEGDIQEEELNVISPNESKNIVNKKKFCFSGKGKSFRKLLSGISRRGKYDLKRVS